MPLPNPFDPLAQLASGALAGKVQAPQAALQMDEAALKQALAQFQLQMSQRHAQQPNITAVHGGFTVQDPKTGAYQFVATPSAKGGGVADQIAQEIWKNPAILQDPSKAQAARYLMPGVQAESRFEEREGEKIAAIGRESEAKAKAIAEQNEARVRGLEGIYDQRIKGMEAQVQQTVKDLQAKHAEQLKAQKEKDEQAAVRAKQQEEALAAKLNELQRHLERMNDMRESYERIKTVQQERRGTLSLQQKRLLGTMEPSLSEKTLNLMADQYLAGDTSVFTNLGRGAQGSANVVALRKAIEQKAGEQGLTGADLAAKNAEFFGVKAGQRSLGTRQANFGMAGSEAMQMADLVTQASERFDRSSFPAINRALQAFETGTGDTNTVQFGAALNSFINAYARAISPSGVPTVSDKDHAREMLSTAHSKDQVQAIIGQMKREMEAAAKAPGMVRGELREAVTGKKAPAQMPRLTKAPPVGFVQNGYRFKGGDPGKKENWEKVP